MYWMLRFAIALLMFVPVAASAQTVPRPHQHTPGPPALAALFRGAVGKDSVSRVWRKVKTDWEA